LLACSCPRLVRVLALQQTNVMPHNSFQVVSEVLARGML
jgi:hypothetical protein